ncbi:Hypothetical protein, putative [Bodo saltans]|uniref:Matrin-type domain-containing protein n=1 Tax=Bodo saltans TaxID=75058 RepID=A0A0S4JR50_BODSA|nr:Hypothetical protein, putative [Bodo saltans]|eukprot:CUG91002.1 Hypothetical protein, putative [Bodo saltans]
MSGDPQKPQQQDVSAAASKRKRSVSATQARRNTLRNEAYGLLWYCDYCDVFVSSKQRTKKQHLAGHAHAQNMEAYYNKLTRDVKTHAADLRHKEMLGVWTAERIEDDWRCELLQDPQTTHRRRLENVIISRRIATADHHHGDVVAVATSCDEVREASNGSSVNRPIIIATSDSISAAPAATQTSQHDANMVVTTTSLMTPAHRVVISPGIVVGGVTPAAAAALLMNPSSSGPATLPAIRVGHVLVSEAALLPSPPSAQQQLGGDDLTKIAVRIGNGVAAAPGQIL